MSVAVPTAAPANKCELTVINKITQDNDILSCHYNHDGSEIFTGNMGGEICRFESRSLKLLAAYQDEADEEGRSDPVTGAVPVPTNKDKFMSSHVNGCVKLWDSKNQNCTLRIKETAQIMNVVPHPTKHRFLTLSEDAKMRLYDLNTGQLIVTFENSYTKEKVTGHNSKIFAAKFHPKQLNEFVSGGWDDTVQFWDMRKPTSLRYLAGPHICGEGLDFDPSGDTVLTCAYQANNPCQLWSYHTAKLFMDMSTETAKLYCGKYLGPKFIMTGASDPCTFRIINMFTYGSLITYKSQQLGVYCLDAVKKTAERKENILNHKIIMASGNMLTEMEVKYTYAL